MKIKGEIDIPNWLLVFVTVGGWVFTIVSIYWSYLVTTGQNPFIDTILLRDTVEYWLKMYGLWGGIIIFAIGLTIFTILGVIGLYVSRRKRR